VRATRRGLPLVEREIQVLAGIAGGGSYAEIAAELQLAHASVKNYAHSAIKKLGARSQAHAVHLAWEAGILRRERHGDHAGFVAHERRGEDPWACTAGCPKGERAYRADRRQKRRQKATGGSQGVQEPARAVRGVQSGDRASDGRTGAAA
jgi:DNA-binding CsgD family transcriptional regulator